MLDAWSERVLHPTPAELLAIEDIRGIAQSRFDDGRSDVGEIATLVIAERFRPNVVVMLDDRGGRTLARTRGVVQRTSRDFATEMYACGVIDAAAVWRIARTMMPRSAKRDDVMQRIEIEAGKFRS